MGLRERHPPPMQTLCFVYHGGRLTEQDGIACQTEDKIGPAPRGDHVNDLRGGKMTVAPDEDVGVWPMVPEIREESD